MSTNNYMQFPWEMSLWYDLEGVICSWKYFQVKPKKNFVKRYPINPKKMFKFAGPKVFISYKQKKVN